jgi:hypothetical protein
MKELEKVGQATRANCCLPYAGKEQQIAMRR